MSFFTFHHIKQYIVPGFLSPGARTFYFVLFLLITVLQTYTALLLEEQLAYMDDLLLS